MSREQQVKDLELAHKKQLGDIIAANFLWCAMIQKFTKSELADPKFKETDKYKAWLNFGVNVVMLYDKWYKRQAKLEKANGVTRFDPKVRDLLLKRDKANIETLGKYVTGWIVGKPGNIGFIPFIVWGVIGIIALYSASQITDQLNETSAEKAELQNKTVQALKDLNIPPDKAAEILLQQTKDSSSGGMFGDIKGLFVMGIAAFFGINLLTKKKSNT